MTETKIVELVIADNEELAIDAISLVSSPAIEQNFVFFGKEKNNLTFAKVDEEKRMLVSPALIPNKNIFRHDPNTDSDYYVYFSKDTVRKASELYLKHNNHHKATYQHQDRVSGVLTVESWIKEGDSDKSKLYGYDLPNGTWFVKMKIENDELWSKIKDGELKGLSIEGYFTNKFEQMQKKEFTNEEVKTALKELLSVQRIELGYLQDVAKTAESAVKKYDKSTDILKAWQSVKRLLTGANKDIMYVRKNRKAFIIGIEGQIEDINAEVKFITDKFKELGEDGSKSKELTTARKSVYQLGNFLKDLKNIDDFDNIKL